MNEKYLADVTQYPESRRAVVAVDGEFTVERVELVKRTPRQMYTLTWYPVIRAGEMVNCWKSRAAALRHIERLKHPTKPGRPPKASLVGPRQLYMALTKREDLRILLSAVRACPPEEVETITAAIKAAAHDRDGAAAAGILTAYYAEHEPGVIS